MPASTSTGTEHRRSMGSFRAVTRFFNTFVLRLAGTRFLPLYGVIEHRGRRTGGIFHAPVVVRTANDGFIVPMPWGETTDWYRNVRAAGACEIRWKGRTYPMAQPEVIDVAAAGSAFGGVTRWMMRRLGIDQCLRLRTVAAAV